MRKGTKGKVENTIQVVNNIKFYPIVFWPKFAPLCRFTTVWMTYLSLAVLC
jgi:hypothetical protein